MQLSERLRAVADFVTPQSRLADVGTDHAYVPIFLAEENRIVSAVAMDIVDGPLRRAQENIRAHGLENRIETRKSDGLRKLQPGEVDAVVVAGMGGLLICRILDQSRETAASVREWILEPQSDTERVREYLMEAEYHICDENMVLEDGKYYPILKAEAGREKNPYTPEELRYGRCLLQKRHPVLKGYLEKELLTLRKLLENLSAVQGERARARELEVREALETAERALMVFR